MSSKEAGGGKKDKGARAVRVLLRDLERLLQEVSRVRHDIAGLSHLESHVLLLLLESGATAEGDPLKTKEIVRRLRIDKASAARTLLRLEKAGLLIRAKKEKDGRTRSVSLTEAGRKKAAPIDAKHLQATHRMLDRLEKKQQERLPKLLECLREAFESELDEE